MRVTIVSDQQGTKWLLAGVVILTIMAGSLNAGAQEGVTASGGKTEGYGSLYIFGASPKNSNVALSSAEFPNTSLSSGIGAGIKAGIFPKFAHGFLGAEADVFGFGSEITSPRTTVSGATRFFNGNLASINTMFDLVARYPGEYLQPYVGVGGGLSLGLLTGADFQSGAFQSISDTGSTAAFAYQLFAGLRANVTKRVFLFGEYKYFAANYDWKVQAIPGIETSLSLNFATHIFAGGLGIRF